MKHIEINSEEIAKLAHVSRSTVSRVINNYPNVPKKTREKVMKVIEEYNYVPNLSAQILAGKKTKTIGLFFINRGHVSEETSANSLITSVIENASALGYYVLTNIIGDTNYTESIKGVKEVFLQRRIDGGIFIGCANHEPMVEELIAEGFIVGIVDQVLPGRNEPNRIVYNFNNEEAAVQAVDYFVGLNHKKIGIINGDMKKSSANFKYKGFLIGMEKHGLQVNDKWIMPGHYEKGGYQAITDLLANSSESDLPTAIFASNDNIAYGALRALQDNNIKVPDEISIIGLNDQMLSAHLRPALSTFRANFGLMMQQITQKVIEKIEEGIGTEFIKVSLDLHFIERESCRKR
ncbi:LacI family DNA-binding transcriptional regulator [Paenibacillus eucommiae]|uniref:LacI family transcriptional regulator n=1 Tax=Paenibacillus eucommiae TaxID=1355755 RepID=A0ABS4J7Z9_9BACL|nr:LacI family DNA-binding transcriptional regulator [Paenibacillus eucommiae]MBP1995982.1 LacI family transcriptional regulator [Paenibacillus eucommiae]